jgi:hypothetical protein
VADPVDAPELKRPRGKQDQARKLWSWYRSLDQQQFTHLGGEETSTCWDRLHGIKRKDVENDEEIFDLLYSLQQQYLFFTDKAPRTEAAPMPEDLMKLMQRMHEPDTVVFLGHKSDGPLPPSTLVDDRVVLVSISDLHSMFRRAGIKGVLTFIGSLKGSNVIQLALHGGEWTNGQHDDAIITALSEVLSATKIVQANCGERMCRPEVWAKLSEAITESVLGHLWIGELQTSGLTPEIRGGKARKAANGVRLPASGMQLELWKNRTKSLFLAYTSDSTIQHILVRGLQYWKNFTPRFSNDEIA